MRRIVLWLGTIFACAVVAAAGVITSNAVRADRAPGQPIDPGCDSDSRTMANVGIVLPGAPAIRCRAWDVGTGVSGYVWHAPSPRAAVLIAHGWGDYSQRYVSQFSSLIPHLLAHGLSVYAFDMWGNGRSPGIRGATDIRAAVGDHVAARRALQNLPVPVFVLGHSVGGLVTASSVLNHPPDVDGMILIAPALRWEVSAGMRNMARLVSLFVPSRPVPVPAPDPTLQSRDSTFLSRLKGDSLYHHGAIPWITAATGATIAHRNWNRYAELSVPLLVVNGGDDQVTTPDAARAFIDLAGSADKALSLVRGGRHMLLDDPPSSTEALDAILAWIERRLSGSEGADSRKAP